MSSQLVQSAFDFERVRLIVSGDFTVKPGWVYGPVLHSNYQIVYFPAVSETRFVTSNKSLVLNKPCVIITPPDVTHSYEFDAKQPVRHLFVTFRWERDEAEGDSESAYTEPVFLHSVEETIVPMLLQQILFLSNKKVYRWEERCKTLLVSALMELEGLKGSPSSKLPPISDTRHSLPVLKALDYIDNHLNEQISIYELAREAGWSHEHFTRKFVQYTGISPQKAIVQRRIERACQLLLQGKSNISEIAYAVGFKNVHYFYRTFMNIKKMTASQYREKYSAPHLMHLSPVNDLAAAYPLNRYNYYP
ncbi:AraC family transcriptional regulator [Paenibacillus senegalensis]|uniref:AraC family transcriptional regulator n=1 Tax=Paenibacillus senegalensis TaxID=1465766 RepID=UPI00028A1295|nr:AraC family transcriptional regulator [Paenibacillus senegalensis]